MAQDTLLGFPAHTLPYRRRKLTTLSTVSAPEQWLRRSVCQYGGKFFPAMGKRVGGTPEKNSLR